MTPLLSNVLLRIQPDARLAALARDGHDLAFEAIVERYSRPLHSYVRRTVPDSAVEDVVQQSFASAWTALRDGAEVRDVRAWLYRIAHNASLNVLRKRENEHVQLHEDLVASDAGPERQLAAREALRAVAVLPDRQREVLLATAVDGRPQDEVAASIGATEGAVRQLVFRARETLRTAAGALVPPPLVRRIAGGESNHDAAYERIAELVAGTGGTAIAATVAKAGAATLVAAVVATGIGGGTDDTPTAEAGRPDEPAGAQQTTRPARYPAERVARSGERSPRRRAARGRASAGGERSAPRRAERRRPRSSELGSGRAPAGGTADDGGSATSGGSAPSGGAVGSPATGGDAGNENDNSNINNNVNSNVNSDADSTPDTDATPDGDAAPDGDRNINTNTGGGGDSDSDADADADSDGDGD